MIVLLDNRQIPPLFKSLNFDVVVGPVSHSSILAKNLHTFAHIVLQSCIVWGKEFSPVGYTLLKVFVNFCVKKNNF